MWKPESKSSKLTILAAVTAVTLGVHYGWMYEPFFGHVHWIHVVHGRFCYIPIVIAASWFGLRGGVYTAFVISVLILPYIFGNALDTSALVDEFAEIVFYFAIAIITGGLWDRELRAQRRAEQMRLQLEQSHKLSLVGQIAAGMAHEIKNPLASIKGAIEIVTDDSTAQPEREEFKGIIFKEVKRINRSLTDFLEFARPSETEFTPIDLSDVLQSGLKQIQAQTRSNHISVKSHIDKDVFVQGEAVKIHQVLLNLLLNAMDASGADTTITVTLKKDSAQNQAVVRVDDSGPGIRAEDIAKVFEPFYTTRASGTGLGLAIARTIVEKHGGTITLANRQPNGVRAEIRLPLSGEEASA